MYLDSLYTTALAVWVSARPSPLKSQSGKQLPSPLLIMAFNEPWPQQQQQPQ
jgi:hypothetical protein